MLRLGCSQYVNKNLSSLTQRRTLIPTLTSKEVDKLNKKKQKRKLASKVLAELVIEDKDQSSTQTISLKERIEQGITVKDASPTTSSLGVTKKSKKGKQKPDVSKLVSILQGKSISASTKGVLSPNPIAEAVSQVDDDIIFSTPQTQKNTHKNKKKKKKKKATSTKGLIDETVQLESEANSKLNESMNEIKQTSKEILSSGLRSTKKKKKKKKKKAKVVTTESLVDKTKSDNSHLDDHILEEAVQISKRKEKNMSKLDSLGEKDSSEILKSVLEMMNIQTQKVKSKHNWKKKTKLKDTESLKPPRTSITIQSESEFWNHIQIDPEDKLKLGMLLELKNPVHNEQSQSKEFDNQTKEKEMEQLHDKVEEDNVSKLMSGIIENVDFTNNDTPELFEKVVNMVGENHQTKKLKELVHKKSSLEELGKSKANKKSKVVVNHDKLRFDLEQSSDDRSVSQLLGNLIDGESTKDNLNVFDQMFSKMNKYEENLSYGERRLLRQKTNRLMQRREKVDFTEGKCSDFFKDNKRMYANKWPTLQEKNQKELINQYIFHHEIQYKNKFSLKMNDKEWKYPIDNEQDIGPEDEVHFSEHVFLDSYLHEFPDVAMIRHYMELVITGLQQNPYLSIGEKKERILWHKDYFDNFSEEDFPTSMNL